MVVSYSNEWISNFNIVLLLLLSIVPVIPAQIKVHPQNIRLVAGYPPKQNQQQQMQQNQQQQMQNQQQQYQMQQQQQYKQNMNQNMNQMNKHQIQPQIQPQQYQMSSRPQTPQRGKVDIDH